MTKVITARSKATPTTGRTNLTQVKINTNITPKMTRVLSDLIGRNTLLLLFHPGFNKHDNRYMRSFRQRHTMAKPIKTRAMRVKASLNAHVIIGSTILNASKIRTNISTKMTKFLSNPIRCSPFLPLLFQSGFEFSQLIIKLILRVELVKLILQTGLTHFAEGFSLRFRIKHFVLDPIKSVQRTRIRNP